MCAPRPRRGSQDMMYRSVRTLVRACLVTLPWLLTLGRSAALAAPQLNAPSSRRASVISPSQIALRWVDTNSFETGYAIERSLSAATGFVQIATTASNVVTYQNTGLAASTTYYYRARAIGQKPSGYSNPANATTLGYPTPT